MPPTTPITVDEICRRYLAGENTTEIAATIGLDRSTVHYWLCKQGVPRRSNSAAKRRYTLREDAFSTIRDEPTAYWLGFLFADGTVTIRKSGAEKAIRLLLKTSDCEHLAKFAAFIGTNAPIRHARNSGSGAEEVTAYSPRMVDDLIRHGCVPNKSASLVFKVPAIELEMQRHFIRGLWDGDGSAFVNRDGTPNLSLCGNSAMLDTIKELVLWHTGVNGNIRPHTISRAVEYLIYRGKSKAPVVGDWLYNEATIFLLRKRRIANAFQRPKHYAGTVGHVSETVVKKYIEDQKGK